MIKKIVATVLLLVSISINAQQDKISNYKYIIVPKKFDFLKKPDQYQTSSLTKFLLQKKGFHVFLSDETFPKDLQKNRCLSLMVNVLNKSNLFATKNSIEFKDCSGKVLYTSKEGVSKEKDYKKAYQQAIREAYNSMSNFTYSYKETQKTNLSNKKVAIFAKKTKKTITSVLYAQKKENGFQLINTKPEVVFQILNTKRKDIFIIKDKNGLLYKKDSHWIAEYYQNNQLIVKQYNIKF